MNLRTLLASFSPSRAVASPASSRVPAPIALADGPLPRPTGKEIGATGTAFYAGFIKSEEFNSSLTGQTGAAIYYKMGCEAQVQATLNFMALPILGAKWKFEAGEAMDDGSIKSDPEIEKFLAEALTQRTKWRTTLEHLLLAIQYGYEVMEKVYDTSDGKRVWLRKLAHRGQQTITKWHTDSAGDLAGIEQYAPRNGSYGTFRIPEVPSVEEARAVLVHMATNQIGNNFEGRSMLRAAYGPWWFKDTAVKIAGIGIERFALGIPVAKEPKDGVTAAARDAMDTLLQNLRSGATASVRLPYGWSIDLLSEIAASARTNPIDFCRYQDEMIAMNVLAMGLKLGSTETGSRSLGDSMFGVFMLLLQSLADLVSSTVTEQIARPLVAMNFPSAAGIAIRTKWSSLTMNDPGKLADYLQKLRSGGIVTADDELENYVRGLVELPALPEGGLPRDRLPVLNPTERQASRAYSFAAARRELAGCGHDHGRVRLADTGDWWRPLRGAEKHIALNEVLGRQNDAVEEVVDIAQKAKADWAESLAEQIAAALMADDVEALSAVAVPEGLLTAMEADLVDVLDDTVEYGRRTVYDERRKQIRAARLELDAASPGAVLLLAREAGARIELRDVPLDDAEVAKFLKVSVREYLTRLSGRVRSLAIERARAIHRTIGEEITEVQIREIIKDVQVFLEQTARNEAKPLVTESVNLGRDAGAQDLADEIAHADYSAILDESVCDVCARADEEARNVELSSQEYFELMPPNRECRSAASGTNRCRCLWIYVFKTDV